ncbi:helix-turn-helix transcriptional regulator [Paraburkholderia phytofirmans]|uniref:helix-turn-helix transcriptional regulator n=1 Tax=Paraburkholderia phytofirmans TaxID=261302 RepID=UPI0011E05A11|nr:AlpA family phage regulatory protein [Paraburkholderia phytofirmans]
MEAIKFPHCEKLNVHSQTDMSPHRRNQHPKYATGAHRIAPPTVANRITPTRKVMDPPSRFLKQKQKQTENGNASNVGASPIDPVLRRQAVRELLGVANSTLHAWIKSGRFPAPLELGPRVRGWRRSVVENYLANCAKASTTDQ